MLDISFPLSAPRGRDLNTRGWLQEAALRCLLNNLDPEVAEDPENLIVYGGRGKAARDLGSLHAIVRTLERLADDETLLIQSGKPVGVFRTHDLAPRVLIANSLLVPRWATLEDFWELEAEGLTMYGQMTAGSWIYIGTQGILQGTFQTFSAIAEQKFGGTLAGTLTLTGGLGGMGGAQPLAITMNGGVALCVEVDPHRIERRLDTGYLDESYDDIDQAVNRALEAKQGREAVSIGLLGNAAEVFPRLLDRDIEIDIVTDQTSAHDPLYGYIPAGHSLDDAIRLREDDPDTYIKAARESMATHCEAMVGFARAGVETFDYGNNLRVCARLHKTALLSGIRTFPMGRPQRGPGRHRRYRSGHRRAVPRQRVSPSLAGDGGGQGPVPRPAGADLLVVLRRASSRRAPLQRAGRRR
jgi:urocanate hydratase